MQVADRDPLGKQKLEHRLEAGIGHVRGADLVGELAVLRIEPVDEDLHVLVGQQLRQVVADHLGEVGQHDGDVVDRLEALALEVGAKTFRDREGGKAECGLADLVARNRRAMRAGQNHQQLADPEVVGGHRGSVNADVVALVLDRDVVRNLDFRHDETVLGSELLSHLCDAEGQFLVRSKQLGGNLLAEHQFDLRGLEDRLDRILFLVLGFLLGAVDLLRLGAGFLVTLARDDPAAESHAGAQQHEGNERQAGHHGQQKQQTRRRKERPGIAAQLIDDGLIGRTQLTAAGDQQAGRQRDDQRRDLADQSVADRQPHEHVGRFADLHVVTGVTDDHTAEHVDAGDQQAGNGIAANELGSTVHGTEERALHLQFLAPFVRLLVVDHAGGQIGINGHLLAGNGVKGKAGADFRDAGRALGDDDEVDRHQNEEDDDADDEIAGHHHLREPADDMTGRLRAEMAFGQDDTRGRDVERQPHHGGDQKDGRER